MEIRGTYPMLYAFFDAEGRLRRDAVSARLAAIAAVPSNIPFSATRLGLTISPPNSARYLPDWSDHA